MGVKFIKDETLSGIADAIRAKTGSAEAIATDEMAAAIASITVGNSDAPTEGGLINGYKFACGTVSFDADQAQAVRIEHEDVGTTIAIFVYVDNAPVVADGVNLRYRVGGYRINVDCDEAGKSGAMMVVNGGVAVGTGGNAGRNKITLLSDTTFEIGCDSVYPLRGGLTYQWLMIGGG